ncbi:MAG TPA: DUF2760 domain-containing protein [Myxococcales bacterium]|jgi:hypothetical protein
MDQQQQIGFFARLWLAFLAYWAILFNPAFAAGVARLKSGAAALPAPAPGLPAKGESDRREALHVLAILQRDGRLIDFLQEDIASFSDAEVGAAARAVHEGCKKTLGAYLSLEPVYKDPEGASITVEQGFDPAAIRLTGNVVGNPPFKGSLRHHGWRAKEVKLPNPPDGQDPAILAPAEVELP